MNQLTQAGSSNATQFLPVKRRRGRPRKYPSLKHVEVARPPPGYEVRENRSHHAETINFSDGGGMVGQAVTGVVEAAFDAGYLLTVKIGSSNTSFRGVVFKPGNLVPVTALNDVAPHLQMIKRHEVPFPLGNQARSSNGQRERTEINGALHVSQGQRLSSQSSALVALKGKHALPASSFTHLNGRGTVVPVLLQSGTGFNGSPTSDSSDKDVVAAEPLAMLLPFGSPSSNQFLSSKPEQPSRVQNSELVPPGTLQNANDSCSDGSHVNEDRGEAAISQMNMDQGIPNIPSPHAAEHLKNDGSGHMTKPLQEDFQTVIDSNVELQKAENPNIGKQ